MRLPVFAGPLQLLLHLIESRQLDVLTVPLAEVADAYVEHLARHPVDPAGLSEFVVIAAQLIWLKSRRMLPGEQDPWPSTTSTSPMRRSCAAASSSTAPSVTQPQALGSAGPDRAAHAPRASRERPAHGLRRDAGGGLLVEALDRLAAVAEPEPPPPEVVAREITIGMQIRALLDALSASGRVILQSVLATCRSRTEAAVTVLATLELVRRRQVQVRQSTVFGPILRRARGPAARAREMRRE